MKSALLLLAASSALMAQSPPHWTLSPRPTLEIGDERSIHTQFDGVAGILRMRGGEIVVANAMSQELRVFSPSGEYLRTLSTGAGAMRALGRIWRSGDTIFAAETLPAESNVWVFTLKGFVERRPIGAANSGGVYPLERFPDGHYVVSAAPRRSLDRPTGLPFTDSVPIGIASAGMTSPPRWIGSLKNEVILLSNPSRGRGGRIDVSRLPIQYPFGRSTRYAVSGDRLWIGDSESGTVTQFTSTGRGLAIFTAPFPVRALDTAAIDRYRSSQLSDAMNWTDRTRLDALYRVLPFARSAPRFTRFLPGVEGEMWIEEFHEDPMRPRRYTVLNRSGNPIGRAVMPFRFVPFDIAADAVVGVSTDNDGVERIVRYALRRTP